jgi:hypothetical protein
MERIRRHVSYANVAATLALVLAMSGGAIAATGGFSSGGTLRACANEEGRLKLLKSGEHCKRGQKSVSWNQTGPVGAPGAKGVAGAPGASGAAGALGAQGASGVSASTAWASVNEAGQLLAGHGVTDVKGSGGVYEVSFDHDISKCGSLATVLNGPTGGRVAYSYIEASTVTVVTVAVQGNTIYPVAFTVGVLC